MNLKTFSMAAAAAVLAAVVAEAAMAGPVIFTVDSTRSSVSFSGSETIPHVGTYEYETQGAGSLTTSYGGTIVIDLEPPNIIFPGGSDVVIETNGMWQPGVGGAAGSAPADYGGKVLPPLTTGYFAARNIQFDVTGSATLEANGSFDATNFTVSYLTNAVPPPRIDFEFTSSVPGDSTNGSTLLTGGITGGTTATLTDAGGTLTLTVPVNATNNLASGSDTTSTVLSGQIVATAPASAWPLAVTIYIEGGTLYLTWPSLTGQTFTVETAGDLEGTWSTAQGKIVSSGATTVWSASSLPTTTQFYRVLGAF